jgi:phage pi2 protein 07
MQKHRWAIIAGVCILALIVVGAVFIPRIFSSSHVEEPGETVMPGHWWKTDLNEQQLKTLQTLWGSDMTIEEFVRQLWPDVMQELPSEMVDIWKQGNVFWPTAKFEDWERSAFQMMCFGPTTAKEGEAMKCFDVYLGNTALEERTFGRSRDFGLVEDRCYRVSMYTDDVTKYQPSPATLMKP